jgi:integrase
MALLEGLDTARAEAVGVTATRRESIEYSWSKLHAFFGPTRDASTIGYTDVEGYIAARRAKGAKGQTIRRESQALKRGFIAAKRAGLLVATPEEWPAIRSDPMKQAQRGKLHPMPVILDWLRELTDDARDEAVFALLTGLRISEVKRVTLSWVEPAPKGAGVRALLRLPASAAKNRKERVVGLPDRALMILKRQAEKRPTSTAFGTESHRKTRAAACRRIGYAQIITPRDLRHTFATLGVQLTGDAVGAQSALGHSQLATTQRYLTATIERVAATSAAVDRLFGGASRGHAKGAQMSKVVRNGGRTVDRTRDIRLVRPGPTLHAHLTDCNYCQALVAQCIETHAEVTEGGTQQGAQTRGAGGAAC